MKKRSNLLIEEAFLEEYNLPRLSHAMKQHLRNKHHSRFKRKRDRIFKKKEAIKSLVYQSKVDAIQKTMKQKGSGKLHKVKGQILPSMVDTNSTCTKSWTRVGYGKDKPLKEGMKHSIIFGILT